MSDSAVVNAVESTIRSVLTSARMRQSIRKCQVGLKNMVNVIILWVEAAFTAERRMTPSVINTVNEINNKIYMHDNFHEKSNHIDVNTQEEALIHETINLEKTIKNIC